MSITMRILLLVSSLAVSAYAVVHMRRTHMQLQDSLFWLLFSLVLVLLGVFPNIAVSLANLLGVMSPANLVFLIVIALLVYKVFALSSRISDLDSKLGRLAQDQAIQETLRGQEGEAAREGRGAHVG